MEFILGILAGIILTVCIIALAFYNYLKECKL